MNTLAVRSGLADAAKTVLGLRAAATMPGSISPPLFLAGEITLDPHGSFGKASSRVTASVVTCYVYVSRATERGAQEAVDGYMSDEAESLISALEADQTLGGVAQAVLVQTLTGPKAYQYAEVDYLGCEMSVAVWA